MGTFLVTGFVQSFKVLYYLLCLLNTNIAVYCRYSLVVQTIFLFSTHLSVSFLFAKYLLFYLSASASACFGDFSAASLSKLVCVFIREYALILVT